MEEVSSVQKLCQNLISSSIQRCRKSDDPCRLLVALKSSLLFNPSVVQISISDTGAGSSLEEFQNLKCTSDPILENWDGVISVITTRKCDTDIYHHTMNLKETISEKRLTKMSSKTKNGAKFSGTEVLLSTCETINPLLADITCFLRKILILKIPTVAIEMVVHWEDSKGSRCENIIQVNESTRLPSSASNIEHLKSGFEDYVMKHGSLVDICQSCFSDGECLKVGSGVACSSGGRRPAGQVMEVVSTVSKVSQPLSPTCLKACGGVTEVLYFKDFSPCSISESSLNALASIDWKSYGLTLRSIAEHDGQAVLEWENMPLYSHVDIVLHCYSEQVTTCLVKQNTKLDRTLTRKAVKLALNDLKEKNAGILLSAHAVKICSYAPDLARTIAGLIMGSNDSDFQEECFSLLGLQCEEIEKETVENCIKEKIVSVIELNDRKPQKSKGSAPCLFKDDCFRELDFMDEEYQEGEEPQSPMDL